MKKLKLFVGLIFLCLLLLPLAACGNRLNTPSALRIDPDTLTLLWRAVPDAQYYTVSYGEETRDVRSNSLGLNDFPAGDYVFRVKACGNGTDVKDSDWSRPLNFTRETEPGMSFKLINGNAEYEVVSLGTAEGEVVIPDVYRGKPVTSIGDKACASRNQLTGITLGENITRIGDRAFYNCSYLEHVDLPSELTYIGEQAFQSCRALRSEIVIPDSVSTIGPNAFAYCRSLPKVTIGSGVSRICEGAFTDCDALTEIVIPQNVVTIEKEAFSACIKVKKLVIGSGVTEIGENAFYGLSALTEVEMGRSVESIGEYAFGGCILLPSVSLPQSLRSIGSNAFYGCTSLLEVSMGGQVEKIGSYAFHETKLYEDAENFVFVGDWLVASKSVEAESYTEGSFAFDGELHGIAGRVFSANQALNTVTLPNSVRIIGDEAFYGCNELYAVMIGSGVTTLGSKAFYQCPKLSTVRLGRYSSGHPLESSLETIESYAFAYCTSLTDLKIPTTVKKIGANAFLRSGIWENASGVVYADRWAVGFKSEGPFIEAMVELESDTLGVAEYAFNGSEVMLVEVPDTVLFIGRAAFYNCKNLVMVNLPETLTRIEDYTFYGCNSLVLDALPNSLQYIGRSAFYKCFRLGTGEYSSGTLRIPSGVKEIGDYAFFGCCTVYETAEGDRTVEGVQHLEIGEGVEKIGNYAFANFASLKSVSLPESVTYLGERAFYKCEGLEEISLGNGIGQILDKTFYGCTSLRRVHLGSVTEIGAYAFYKCSALTVLELGDALTSIGNYAFSGCSALETLVLPERLSAIGKQAFRGCVSLTSVTLGGELTFVDQHAFYGCSSLTIYTAMEEAGPDWSARWNSSYRPVIWGCTLSSDGGYVGSFTMTESAVSNLNELTELTAPYREGYTFVGWQDENGNLYGANEIADIPSGAVLTAQWR